MPRNKDKSNFDLDINFGIKGEKHIINLFEGDGKVEVKTERDIWMTTGNLAFEIKGFEDRLSGISTTKATWWIHILSYNDKPIMHFCFNVASLKKALKRLVKNKNAKIKKGGDKNYSTIILAPINKLLQEYYEVHS